MEISFSSALPDAIQKALGLPGGAGTFEKAAGGILVTVAAVWILAKGLKRWGKRQ
jgi:hypothetical protein